MLTLINLRLPSRNEIHHAFLQEEESIVELFARVGQQVEALWASGEDVSSKGGNFAPSVIRAEALSSVSMLDVLHLRSPHRGSWRCCYLG